MTDCSHYLRVVWLGLPQSVNPLKKVLLISLLQTGKLRLREVKYLAKINQLVSQVMNEPRQIDLGTQLLTRSTDKPFAIL